MRHIFEGYDHLALLVGLLARSSAVLPLARAVTSFTVAHSLTLILGTFGFVPLSSRWIESLIALTVVYVGLENLWGTTTTALWRARRFSSAWFTAWGSPARSAPWSSLEPIWRSRSCPSTSASKRGRSRSSCLCGPSSYLVRLLRWHERATLWLSLGVVALGAYWFAEHTARTW